MKKIPQSKASKTVKNVSPQAKRKAALIIANTLILTFIYFGAMSIDQPLLSIVVTAVYWVAFAVLLTVYLIYNRAFSRKSISADMLPDSWSEEKKETYISDGKRRTENSKWMLAVIIPIMIPIMLDAIYLFTFEMLKGLFNFS